VGLALGEQGQAGRATRLWGAAQALRAAIGATPGPVEQRHHERFLARVRPQLGDETYAAELAMGLTLPLAAMIAEAVEAAPGSGSAGAAPVGDLGAAPE